MMVLEAYKFKVKKLNKQVQANLVSTLVNLMEMRGGDDPYFRAIEKERLHFCEG